MFVLVTQTGQSRISESVFILAVSLDSGVTVLARERERCKVTRRNETTYDAFLAALKMEGLDFSLVDLRALAST